MLALNPAGFDVNASYVFFRAGPNASGTNNDYLVWKATTATPSALINTATVTAPARPAAFGLDLRALLAVAGGAALAAAFAPLGLWPLAVLCPALLM